MHKPCKSRPVSPGVAGVKREGWVQQLSYGFGKDIYLRRAGDVAKSLNMPVEERKSARSRLIPGFLFRL